MKFWFDTEFYEDGRTIELISIGIVAEDSRVYYAETTQARALSCATPWLEQNVLPHLEPRPSPLCKSREDIAADIVRFVGEKPEFWAYYADYDWVALCQLYGPMIHLPKGWPMFCRDVQQVAVDRPHVARPLKPQNDHNALADAIWVRSYHLALMAAGDA